MFVVFLYYVLSIRSGVKALLVQDSYFLIISEPQWWAIEKYDGNPVRFVAYSTSFEPFDMTLKNVKRCCGFRDYFRFMQLVLIGNNLCSREKSCEIKKVFFQGLCWYYGLAVQQCLYFIDVHVLLDLRLFYSL